MEWSSTVRTSPTSACPGPLDEAVARLVWLALLDWPDRVAATLARFGVAGDGGAPPTTVEGFDAALGDAPPGAWTAVRRRLLVMARACPPPASLGPSLELVDGLVPATPGACADALRDAGLTTGLLHPAAVVAVANLWRSPHRWRVTDAADAGPLVVAHGWPGLSDLRAEVRAAGVLDAGRAGRRAATTVGSEDPDVGLGLLRRAGLHVPGSRVVWDRERPGPLLARVSRTLAAAGPILPEVLAGGLARVPGPPVPPAPWVLAGWAAEQPSLAVDADGRISLAGAPAGWRGHLSARDRAVVAHLRRRRGTAASDGLHDALVTGGLFRSRSAARVFVATAPYLRSPVRGRTELLGRG